MSVIKRQPTSPGRRFVINVVDKTLHKGRPERSLTSKKNRISCRNNNGHITVRHRGGGSKKIYRIVDFKRNKDNIPATVTRVEYDPNRNAHIALIVYKDGVKSYIICPKGLKVGSVVNSGEAASIQSGNSMPIKSIPIGLDIHCVELKPQKGAQLARSAGSKVRLLAKEDDWATIKLASGETRKVHINCRATIGEVGNSEYNLQKIGKAGASRWRGRRPSVRGVAMNPIDHPHGGGEGKSSGGRHPVSPWGQPTKGYKTRNNKRTDHLILYKRK